MSAPSVTAAKGERSVSMRAKIGGRVLPIQRRERLSPYVRLAQELGYSKEKTARDNVARPYIQAAITNRVLLEAGWTEKVGELNGIVTASLMGENIPAVAEAIYRAACADADEDRVEAEFIHRSGDAELESWIKKLAADIHNSEVLLAALIRERDGRKAK